MGLHANDLITYTTRIAVALHHDWACRSLHLKYKKLLALDVNTLATAKRWRESPLGDGKDAVHSLFRVGVTGQCSIVLDAEDQDSAIRIRECCDVFSHLIADFSPVAGSLFSRGAFEQGLAVKVESFGPPDETRQVELFDTHATFLGDLELLGHWRYHEATPA